MSGAAASPAPMTDLLLAELMAAQLCHDLGGAIGTVCTAIEIAAEDTALGGEAVAFAREAAGRLAARLRLLRAAWAGTATALTVAELAGLAHGLARTNLALATDGLVGRDRFTPAASRLVLNALLLAAESLPGGGAVRLAGDTGAMVAVAIEGPRAAWPSGLGVWLADEASARAALAAAASAPHGARLPQGAVTALVARAVGLAATLPIGVAHGPAAPPLLLRLSSEG